MEMQIQDLVCAIKKEGVDAAEAQAAEIIAEAEKKAAGILADAKDEADRILKKAENEIEILEESAKTTAEHAKRDAMLFFKESVQKEFAKLLSADVEKVVKNETLAKLIAAAVNEDDPANYAAEVAEITDGLKSELAAAIRSGLELKVNPNVRVGFRLTVKDGSGYFDCADEELEKMLAPFFPELSI